MLAQRLCSQDIDPGHLISKLQGHSNMDSPLKWLCIAQITQYEYHRWGIVKKMQIKKKVWCKGGGCQKVHRPPLPLFILEQPSVIFSSFCEIWIFIYMEFQHLHYSSTVYSIQLQIAGLFEDCIIYNFIPE